MMTLQMSVRAAQAFKPHAYQKKAIKFLVEHAAAGLWLDPGLGKTAVTLGALKVLQKLNPNERMLVIAPLRPCYLVWPKEVEKWCDFRHLKMEVLHGPKKADAAERPADVYVINPEGLSWLLSNNGALLKKLKVTTLVVDESSKFKKTNTQRFKLLKPHLSKFLRRWTLTGTPAPNGLMDVFGQIYIMDLGKALGRYVTHYRSTFFYPSGFGGYDWKLREGADKEIYARLKPSVLRLSAEDYLELPELIHTTIYVELPTAARRVYTEMEKEMLALIDGDPVTARTASAVSGKCCQVANGAIYMDTQPGVKPLPGERWREVHTAKTDALVDLLDELQGKPVLVGYDFNHDLERLLKTLGKDTPVIGGGTSAKRAASIEAAWNAGALPWMLGHPASMGHGLNFQYGGCADVAWFGVPWDLELYDQFIKRVQRQGNTAKRVRVYHLIARDTVDEDKLMALSSKNHTQRALLDALKARGMHR